MTRLVILRASHVSPDPRVERAASVAAARGWDVDVLAWDREGELDQRTPFEHGRIDRFRRPAAHGRGMANFGGLILFQAYLVRRLLRWCRSVDAIHACDLSTGLVGLMMARLLGVPMIYDVFDYYADSFPVPSRALRLVRRLENFVIQSADEVILPAEWRTEQIHPARPQRLTIVENSPNLGFAKVAADPQLEPTDLAYVGILAPGRLLTETLDILVGRQDISIRVAGFGPLSERVQDIADNCDNVDFVGKVSTEQALRIMARATMMFATYDPRIPNHRFSAPNKFAEALALGKPLIVCGGTSIDAEVAATGFGAVVDYDAIAFFAAVDRIKGDPELLERCRTKGPLYYAGRHSWSVNADRLDRVYARTVPMTGQPT